MKNSISRILTALRPDRRQALDPLSSEFFEARYRQSEDPWNFAGSPYESGRYQAILEALGERRFARAFEPGCSVGVLTAELAKRCDEVVAVDFATSAAERAAERCREWPHVHVRVGSLPEDLPDGRFDLIVFSEIGYYFQADQLSRLCVSLTERLMPGGLLVGCHWLGTSADHVLGGDEVQEIIGQTPGLRLSKHEMREKFRLDTWVWE